MLRKKLREKITKLSSVIPGKDFILLRLRCAYPPTFCTAISQPPMSSKLLTMRSRRTAACRIAESRFAGRGALETQGAPQKFAPENQGRSFCFFDPGGRRRAAGAARSRDRFNQTSLQKHASLCSPARAPCRVECDPLFSFGRTWLMGKKRSLGVCRRVSHERAKALANNQALSSCKEPWISAP
jgi:hypothetical protein